MVRHRPYIVVVVYLLSYCSAHNFQSRFGKMNLRFAVYKKIYRKKPKVPVRPSCKGTRFLIGLNFKASDNKIN